MAFFYTSFFIVFQQYLDVIRLTATVFLIVQVNAKYQAKTTNNMHNRTYCHLTLSPATSLAICNF